MRTALGTSTRTFVTRRPSGAGLGVSPVEPRIPNFYGSVLGAALLLLLPASPAPAAPQAEGEVDRIMLKFFQQREKVGSQEGFKRLVAATREQLEKFVKENPGNKDLERAEFHIAESLHSEEKLTEALGKFRAFVKDRAASPNAAAARFALGEIQLQMEKDAEARAAFEDFVKAHPKDERALYAKLFIGITLQNERKYDEAAAALAAAREEFKGRKESWSAVLQLAIVRHAQEKNAEARAALEEVVRDCPERGPADIARRHLAEYLKMGKPAPAFVDKDSSGQEVSLEKLRGRVVVLYFFDTSLAGAVAEASFLRRMRETFKPEDLEIVGISVNPEKKDLATFLAEKHASWPLVHDGKGFDGLVPLLYGIRGLPSLTVIDRKGTIRFFNLAGRDLRHALLKLVEEK